MNYTVKLIERISETLGQKLKGFVLDEAFCSGKNELYINFKNTEKHFGIRLSWAARSCFIFFQDETFQKPVPHQQKFEPLNEVRILSVRQHKNNRSFQINFENGLVLVFKLYDGLSNVLLFQNGALVISFRTSIEKDLHLKLGDFDKEESYLKQGKKNSQEDATDIFEALNQSNKKELSEFAFDELKRNLIQKNTDASKRFKQLIAKSTGALQIMRDAVPFDEIGNIIMANLQFIKPQQTQVELFDFYRNKNILIKLKKELNAPKNAEYYYRKFKNQKMSEEQLISRTREAGEQLEQLQLGLQKLREAQTLKELKLLSKEKVEVSTTKQELFKAFECDGFKILVGKSAANNDLLTMKHAHKNDLWLHAKGVSGSHVVVKHIPGKPFTKNVVAHAASIAAYFSKSKGSAFVPVVYVERKFVRKPKGAEPGAVVIDKEEVILAKPEIVI